MSVYDADGNLLAVKDGSITKAKLSTELQTAVDDVSDLKSSLYGFNAATKSALLALLQKVAYVDTDGQELYDALEDALYPPLDVDYITAVYTQSGTVYDTDTLDSLKPDLAVTAHYSDGTSGTVTNYALTGTLAEGTSTITVAYGGKTDTFTVSVTQGALYPFENGTHSFSSNSRTLAVSSGYHFAYSTPNATSSTSSKGAYLNLSNQSQNDESAINVSNVNKTITLFTLPNGSTVVFKISNIIFTNVGDPTSANKYAIALRNNTTSVVTTGDHYIADTADITITNTMTADTPITCVFAYVSNPFSSFSADVSLTVDGVRWI